MVVLAKKTLYDQLRAQIPAVPPPDKLLVTRGVMGLGSEAVAAILAKVRDFDTFSEDNDPWGEHDLGTFEHDGAMVMFKIDDYTQQPEPYRYVLTVLLAQEY